MRNRSFFACPLVILLLLAMFGGPVFAGVYKWTDTDGVTHLSDHAPRDVSAERVRLEYSRADPHAVQRLAARIEANREAYDARVTRREERQQQVRESREQSRDCDNARNYRKRLLAANRLFRVNDQGVRERVDESARAEDLNRIDKAIGQLCS